jgi:UDP-N-acetylglucosamine:LPS N-acetylglucosamine transferase
MGESENLTAQLANIVFVSRGRGRGHAVPDMAIAEELRKLSDVQIHFVSYAAGAEAYRACGYEVMDLHMPDNAPFLEMVVTFARLFGQVDQSPQLVISHEEFAVLPAAAIWDIPCVFITDFFADPPNMYMQTLKYAREIIYTAEQGLYTEPPYLRGKVHYVGRAVRPFEYSLADRNRARLELRIPNDATVALFQPGGWFESRVPVADLLIAAWELLTCTPKRLIWLAGRDYDSLYARVGERADVLLLREDWKIDRLMAASNVLITKANRLTVYEAAALGLPSVSVSNLVNWPDDVAVGHVPSNIPLAAEAATPELLAEALVCSIGSQPGPAREVSDGVRGAAQRLAYRLDEMRVLNLRGCRIDRH